MVGSRRFFAVASVVLLLIALGPAGRADTGRPAPEPFPPAEGPALSVAPATLAAALDCPAAFEHTDHEPVLLVPGTGFNAETNWSWGYKPSLTAKGFDVCTIDIPDLSMSDMQVAGEYTVFAVREIASRSSRMVDMLGISQGAMHPRWAVKWWPDVRVLVDDLVQLVAPNHGTLFADLANPLGCTPSCHQMQTDSAYNAALNADDETPGDVSYTSIYTLTDELVQPQVPESTSALNGATNIAIQDVCPGRPTGHGASVFDIVPYSLALDAFTQPGAADTARFDAGNCTKLNYDGTDNSKSAQVMLNMISGGPPPFEPSREEPPLAPYAQG